jgi:hypothetical protein
MPHVAKILSNYDNSFVNDYAKWCVLVDEVNSFIPIYLDSMHLTKQQVQNFTYNEFCSAYRKEVEGYLRDKKMLDDESVNYILDVMVTQRIIKAITSP